jgi:hypothetical protein
VIRIARASGLALGLLASLVANAAEARENGPMTDTESRNGKAIAPLARARTDVVTFTSAPFPYDGTVPASGKPFLDVTRGTRRGHDSPRGGVYWEKPTYSDRSVLLHLPKGFDLSRPALIVVYFHGNRVKLLRDVRDRQQILQQLDQSGLNAALVVPQLAVDALDSSAGGFWEPGRFARFLDEAADQLARLHGGAHARERLAKLPVVAAAYSGGYLPVSYAANVGDTDNRLIGMMLFDAPYSEEEVLAEWLTRRHSQVFFVSAFATAARPGNNRLRDILAQTKNSFGGDLPRSLAPGVIAFHDIGDGVVHGDFMTEAWTTHPFTDLLARIPGYPRQP